MAQVADEWFDVASDEVILLQEQFKESGVRGVSEQLRERLDEWKNVPLDIGITGMSGSGKSSFINAIRGLTADDEGGAHVDCIEATKEPTPYHHPDNNKLILWDLPGVGTQNFPKGKYLESVNFEKFDFFIVFSRSRFMADDMWLAKEIRKRRKRFYFVRTCIDEDIRSDKKAHPKTHSANKVLDRVRRDCIDQLNQQCVENEAVYLIDNYATELYDFGLLAQRIIKDAPFLKKEAFTLSMSIYTQDLIKQKQDALKKRIWKVATISAISNAAPIPGIGAAADIALLVHEAKFYRRQFGLNDEALNKRAGIMHISVEALKKACELKSGLLSFTAAGLVRIGAGVASLSVLKSTSKIALPIIGCVLASGLSYAFCVITLRHILQLCANDASKLAHFVAEKKKNDI